MGIDDYLIGLAGLSILSVQLSGSVGKSTGLMHYMRINYVGMLWVWQLLTWY